MEFDSTEAGRIPTVSMRHVNIRRLLVRVTREKANVVRLSNGERGLRHGTTRRNHERERHKNSRAETSAGTPLSENEHEIYSFSSPIALPLQPTFVYTLLKKHVKEKPLAEKCFLGYSTKLGGISAAEFHATTIASRLL